MFVNLFIYLFRRFIVFHLSLCWGAGGVLCLRRSTVEEASRVTVSYAFACVDYFTVKSDIRDHESAREVIFI